MSDDRTRPDDATPDAAANDDVTTLDGIISALYDSISGPADRKRDLRRFRSLFHEGARLVPTRLEPETGAARALVLEVDEYFKMACEQFRVAGFFEREIARRTERFGHIVHVFSTYDSRHKADDPKPFARGINSIQLMNDGRRWWVVSIFWESEGPQTPIPQEFLPGEPKGARKTADKGADKNADEGAAKGAAKGAGKGARKGSRKGSR
jgi:hypothetical protein